MYIKNDTLQKLIDHRKRSVEHHNLDMRNDSVIILLLMAENYPERLTLSQIFDLGSYLELVIQNEQRSRLSDMYAAHDFRVHLYSVLVELEKKKIEENLAISK